LTDRIGSTAWGTIEFALYAVKGKTDKEMNQKETKIVINKFVLIKNEIKDDKSIEAKDKLAMKSLEIRSKIR
jgi:hypothetical protein